MTQFDSSWMAGWRTLVNENEVLSHVGKHLNADVLLEFGETSYVVSFRKGRIVELEEGVSPETCWNFGLRGPDDTWAKFCEDPPPPMYNDIWAMAPPLHGRRVFDGDVKVLWQNLRAFTWALDRMREVKG